VSWTVEGETSHRIFVHHRPLCVLKEIEFFLASCSTIHVFYVCLTEAVAPGDSLISHVPQLPDHCPAAGESAGTSHLHRCMTSCLSLLG